MKSDNPESITGGRQQEQDNLAIQALWKNFQHRLENMARRRLNNRREDVEDAARSAFNSGIINHNLVNLPDHHQIMLVLMQRLSKRTRQILRQEQAQKRGSNRVVSESQLRDSEGNLLPLDEVSGQPIRPQEKPAKHRQSFPDDVALETVDWQALSEELLNAVGTEGEEMVMRLGPYKCNIAILVGLGYSNREIAKLLGMSPPVVEANIKEIRKAWTNDGS